MSWRATLASIANVSIYQETNNSVRPFYHHVAVLTPFVILPDASVPWVSALVPSPIIVKLGFLFLIQDHNFGLDWMPNHLLVVHTLLLFSILNPFVLPFGALYFLIQTGKIHSSWRSKWTIFCNVQVSSKIRSITLILFYPHSYGD